MVAESASMKNSDGKIVDYLKFTQNLIFEEKFADFKPFFGYLGDYKYSCFYEKSLSTVSTSYDIK